MSWSLIAFACFAAWMSRVPFFLLFIQNEQAGLMNNAILSKSAENLPKNVE